MDMKLSPEQQKLRHAARELAEAEFAAKAAEIDRTEAYPYDNVAALKAAGFMGYTIPTSHGGRGGSYFEAALIIEEMARVCGATGRITVEANMGAISAVMQYGTEKQKRLGADLVLSGDKPAICITEPEAGSAATEMTTRADKHGNTYVIRGKKHWITGGGVSKLHLIFARVFDERGREQGIGGFLAVRGAPGLVIGKREPAMGLRGIPETEIIFENLEIPEDMLVLPPRGLRRGFADLIDAYNSQRVGAGTVALGLAQGAFEKAMSLREGAKAVRAADRRIPGPAVDAGRHGGGAQCRAAVVASGGAERRSVSGSAAGGAGQDHRFRDGEHRHEPGAAIVRRERVLAGLSARTHGPGRPHVHDCGRHGAGAADAGRVPDSRHENPANTQRLRGGSSGAVSRCKVISPITPRGYAWPRNAPDGHRMPMRRCAPETPHRR